MTLTTRLTTSVEPRLGAFWFYSFVYDTEPTEAELAQARNELGREINAHAVRGFSIQVAEGFPRVDYDNLGERWHFRAYGNIVRPETKPLQTAWGLVAEKLTPDGYLYLDDPPREIAAMDRDEVRQLRDHLTAVLGG